MNRMMAIVEREMRKFFRSPALMLASMIMPLVQLIVLGNAFGGKIRDARVAIVDQDGGPQALRIREAFDSVRANIRTFVPIYYDSQKQAVEDVRNGKLEGAVIIPPEFSRRVYEDNHPQIAVVALNPHTGQVLALVGGRNYGASQFDHAVQHRPTGSIFKPFVYAAAFNTSLAGTVLTQPPPQAAAGEELVSADPAPPDPGRQSGIFTAITMLSNRLTTFENGYAPSNYHHDTRYEGDITARTAL